MIPTKKQIKDLKTGGQTLAQAARNRAAQARLARDAAQVIAKRVGIATVGMIDPRRADPVEMTRMVAEKHEAFTAAGQIAWARWLDMNSRLGRAMAEEGQLLASTSQSGTAEAVNRYVWGWFGRAGHTAVALAAMGQRSQQAVMAPVHRTAAANARRLRD